MGEAAPQARPKTTEDARNVVDVHFAISFSSFAIAWTSLVVSGLWFESVRATSCPFLVPFHALPVPMLRQVSH